MIAVDQSTTWNNYPGFFPTGFRIDIGGFTYFAAAPQSALDASGPVRIDTNGALLYYGARGGKRLRATCQWTTSDPWPITLPGKPV